MWIDDKILEQCHKPMHIEVWQPDSTLVVCGRSNDPKVEVDLESCVANSIPVLKRYGGGGTVVLHSGCIVISLGMWVDSYYDNAVFFDLLNGAVIASLADINPVFSDLSQDGLSDIVFKDKKIAGTSLFRSRNYLLYQASVLVEDKITLIEKYLRHPSKEPDYRAGRSHADFITNLKSIDPNLTVDALLSNLSLQYSVHVKEKFKGRHCQPFQDQISHVLAKISRG